MTEDCSEKTEGGIEEMRRNGLWVDDKKERNTDRKPIKNNFDVSITKVA